MPAPKAVWSQTIEMAAQAAGRKAAAEHIESLQGGGNGPYDSSMETRVSRLEGAIDGTKQSQSILVMSMPLMRMSLASSPRSMRCPG